MVPLLQKRNWKFLVFRRRLLFSICIFFPNFWEGQQDDLSREIFLVIQPFFFFSCARTKEFSVRLPLGASRLMLFRGSVSKFRTKFEDISFVLGTKDSKSHLNDHSHTMRNKFGVCARFCLRCTPEYFDSIDLNCSKNLFPPIFHDFQVSDARARVCALKIFC